MEGWRASGPHSPAALAAPPCPARLSEPALTAACAYTCTVTGYIRTEKYKVKGECWGLGSGSIVGAPDGGAQLTPPWCTELFGLIVGVCRLCMDPNTGRRAASPTHHASGGTEVALWCARNGRCPREQFHTCHDAGTTRARPGCAACLLNSPLSLFAELLPSCA